MNFENVPELVDFNFVGMTREEFLKRFAKNEECEASNVDQIACDPQLLRKKIDLAGD